MLKLPRPRVGLSAIRRVGWNIGKEAGECKGIFIRATAPDMTISSKFMGSGWDNKRKLGIDLRISYLAALITISFIGCAIFKLQNTLRSVVSA